MHRMVRRLARRLENLHEPPAVARRRLNGGGQLLRREVIRARAGHEETVALHELEGKLVQLAIGGLALRNVLLALDERRWIEDHDVEALTVGMQRLQCIEGICLEGV